MGRDIENLLPINLNSIAKDDDIRETIKLCQLIICIAVQCHKNQIYIGKIQSLSQQSQHALMLSIEEVRHGTFARKDIKIYLNYLY